MNQIPLIYHAVVFGVVAVLIGLLLASIFSFLKPELPTECDVWDKYYVMEVILFFTGVILRCLMEVPSAKKYLYHV